MKKFIFKEQIAHTSQTLPYTLHHTYVNKSKANALYLHWHEEFEFFYLKEGHLLFTIENKDYELHSGEGIFIPTQLLHKAKSLNDSACSYYAIVFSPTLFQHLKYQNIYLKFIAPYINTKHDYITTLVLNITWQKSILTILQDLFTAISEDYSIENLQINQLKIEGSLFLIWDLLFSNHLLLVEETSNTISYNDYINDILLFLHHNYQENISLSTLSNLAHLSQGQFCRSFKKYIGLTPFEYLNRYRILKSCSYLINSDMKIADIALICGFCNISHYNRLFLRYMKTTPSAYKKSSKNISHIY